MRRLFSSDGRSLFHRAHLLAGMALLVLLLVAMGVTSCKKEAEEGEEPDKSAKKEDIMTFEGNVKVVVGKYVFLPEVSGFDIVVQGGDTEALVGKDIRGEGEFSIDKPSILVANSIEMKDESGKWTNVFTRSEDVVLEDYMDLEDRDEFPVLEDLSYDKKTGWEDQERAKVFGALVKENNTTKISIYNDKNELVGKVIVDGFSDYSDFYIKKLRLFDKFWFYINIKETVDWSDRRRSKEMFHADVLFAGLF